MDKKSGRINLSRTETNSKRAFLRHVNLDKTRASEAERIGAMPDGDRRKEFDHARKANVLNTVRGMLLAKIDKSKGGRPAKNLSRRETGLRQDPRQRPPSRRSRAARDAGLSDDQRKNALRIANVPRGEFERAGQYFIA